MPSNTCRSLSRLFMPAILSRSTSLPGAYSPPARPRPKKGDRHQRPRHDQLHVTGDPPPADRPDPGLRTRPRARLVLVPLASATPVPGPALPLQAARLCVHLTPFFTKRIAPVGRL